MFDATATLNQLAQSNHGMSRLSGMIGAKNFVKSEEDNYVSFRFMRGAANKANFCKITLNSMDTYDIEFSKITTKKWGSVSVKPCDTFYGIYNDGLKEVFENETKLYLSL